MKRRRSFLRDVVPLRCPDCGRASVVRAGSVLGTLSTAQTTVDASLLRHISADYNTYWTKAGVVCMQCGEAKNPAHWLLLQPTEAGGPWCSACLRSVLQFEIEDRKGMSKDMIVLLLSSAAETHRILSNVSKPPIHTLPVDSDSLLF